MITRPTMVCTLLACASFACAGLHEAGRASATWDEVAHIGAGAAYLQGEWRLNPEHPPLVKLLAAWAMPKREPALQLPASFDAELTQWTFGSAYIHNAKQPPLELLKAARTPIVLLNTSLLLCLAVLSEALLGAHAARIAVLLAALCPLWLAHASLVTTDAAATLFFYASVACGSWLLGANTFRSRVSASLSLALSLALATATKYSMLAAPALVLIGYALDAARARKLRTMAWPLAAAGLGLSLGVCFAWGLAPNPIRYWQGVRQIGHNHHAGLFYAFGEFFQGTSPLYFARALLVKVSLPTLMLAVMGLLLRRGNQPQPCAATRWLLIVPPLGYYAIMAGNAPAIGVRYVLPVLPFLFMLAGKGGARLLQQPRARLWLVPLGIAQIASLALALRATPIAFFNGLFCSTGDALPCLDDSNVDWGQALPNLKQFRDERYPNTPIRVFYFGSSPPEAYVDRASVAAPDELARPKPALYAMSVHLRARCPLAAWPRQLAPSQVVGGVYAIFDLRGSTR